MQLASVGQSCNNDDCEIISRCQSGDVESFGILVERYQKKMLNTACRMLGNYEDACDVVQDAFVSAFKALPKFRGEASFSTWMTTIVLNHSKNKVKQKNYRSRYDGGSIDAPLETHDGEIVVEHPSKDLSVIERLEKRQSDQKVQACIDMLDEEQKQVIVLRDIQELSYEEICNILNLPEGTVKSRLFRARNTLKDVLSKKLGDLL